MLSCFWWKAPEWSNSQKKLSLWSFRRKYCTMSDDAQTYDFLADKSCLLFSIILKVLRWWEVIRTQGKCTGNMDPWVYKHIPEIFIINSHVYFVHDFTFLSCWQSTYLLHGHVEIRNFSSTVEKVFQEWARWELCCALLELCSARIIEAAILGINYWWRGFKQPVTLKSKSLNRSGSSSFQYLHILCHWKIIHCLRWWPVVAKIRWCYGGSSTYSMSLKNNTLLMVVASPSQNTTMLRTNKDMWVHWSVRHTPGTFFSLHLSEFLRSSWNP